MKRSFKNCVIAEHIDTLIAAIQQQQAYNNHPHARGEDILYAIYQWSCHYPQIFTLFWKLVGLQNARQLGDYFDQCSSQYTEESQSRSSILQGKNHKLKLHARVASHQKILDRLNPRHLDFFVLRYGALHDLSPQFIAYCTSHRIALKTIISQTTLLSENTLFLELGSFAFLNLVITLMSRLSLSLDDITMLSITNTQQIDQLIHEFGIQSEQQFLADNDGKLFPHNNYESDVLDETEEIIATEGNKSKTKEKKLMVDLYGSDLTRDAKEHRLDPVIGRDQEIKQVIYTLLRKTKSNPLLIGEAGVGKTAIVEGLAQRIASGDVPEKLKDKRIIMLDVPSIVAGTKYRGDFEARFKMIMEEASDPLNNIILFIDEIHTMIGAGGSAGTDDASQLIKPLLARGKLKLIAATTFDEYQEHIEKDAALKRRFQEVMVQEPSLEDTKEILLGLKPHFEDFHNVRITDESIDAAIALTQRYVMNKQFPDKAIDVVDEAAARVSTLTSKVEQDETHQTLRRNAEKLEKRIQKAITDQDYFLAADLKLKEKLIKDQLSNIRASKSLPLHLRPSVDRDNIGSVLADKTGVPTSIVTESEINKLKRLKETLSEQILGQDEAVEAVVKTLQRSRLSVIERNRPIASFFLLGPSGVGKTYLAKLIAQEYFGDPKAMIRVDMSEFMESYTVSKLIGSAPGYVGYESGGMLTEQVRRRPYSVILLDEIEKANPEVLNILLQILDEGQLKDNKGRMISFKSTIIIMTSNLGAEEFSKKQVSIGFGDHSATKDKKEYSDQEWKELQERVQKHMNDFITPELRNRIDYTIIFKPLSKLLMQQIFKIKLKEFLSVWTQKTDLKIPRYSTQKITSIIDKIYDPQFGARPIDKYIHNTIEPELIEKVMNTPNKA